MLNRKKQNQIQSAILDTAAACAVGALYHNNPHFFNPWNLNLSQWIIGGLAIRVAISFYDHLVVLMVDSLFKHKLLPTRTTGKAVRYVSLDTKSTLFLSINALHEWIFVQRLCHYIWFSSEVSLNVDDIGPLNTLVSLWLMFVVLDFVYAPCHHILHVPAIYPLIHKHHHRQHFPTRGYLDAGNEHPIEHIIGVICTWTAVLAAVKLTNAHAVTIFAFFNIHAALAMLNHSPYDVEFDIIPFGILQYSVSNHEMHHRKFTINYSQYCMWYDHLMKTFGPYEGPKNV